MTEIKKLSDIAEFINGGAWDQGSYSDKGIAVVRVSDVKNGEIDLSQCKFLKKELSEKYKKHQLQEDDLIICTVGSHPTQPGSVVGRTAVVSSEVTGSYLNQNAVLLRAKEGFDQKWLGFLGSNPDFHSYIKAHARGAASQVRMSISALKEMPIPSISLAQQKKSSDILDTYRSSIRNNLKKIKVLEKMAQTIYIEWFVNFRFPGHENVNLVDSKTDFGEIPEGWTVEKMLDVGQVITGKTPSKLIESNFGHEVPFIKTPDLHGNIFCIKTSEYLSEKGANSQKKKTLPRNTLIVSCIGTLGVVSITTKESQTNQQINALVPNDDTFLEYGYFLLKGMKKQLQNLGSNGATMGNVNKGKFENIKVILPSKANLNEFNQVTSTMFQLIENLQKQNLYLTQTRDLLIPKLVTGEIEIKG